MSSGELTKIKAHVYYHRRADTEYNFALNFGFQVGCDVFMYVLVKVVVPILWSRESFGYEQVDKSEDGSEKTINTL